MIARPDPLIVFLSIKSENPLVVLAKTIKGKGIKELEDKLESHYIILDKPMKIK